MNSIVNINTSKTTNNPTIDSIEKPKEKTQLSNNYKLLDKIGSGSFGDVYLAIDKKQHKFAAKVEDIKEKTRLKDEYNAYRKIYRKLIYKNINTNGIPKVYNLLETPQYYVMIMDILGPCLDSKFNELNKKFEMSTILKIGIDAIKLLQKIHASGFIHRDIKPNNFLMNFGNNNKQDTLFIMDFGLSKQYISGGRHLENRTDRTLVGTVRYVSLNVHMGLEPARRDDLESVGYMLVYFAKGCLPWQGMKKDKKKSQIIKVGEVKLCTDINKLCDGLPECIPDFIKYCRNLKYEENPDYNMLVSSFENSAKKLNITPQYEWLKN